MREKSGSTGPLSETGETGAVLPPLSSDADVAIGQLFDRYHRRMLRAATVLVGDGSLAEDVVQDAFIAVHGAWGRVRDKEAAGAYLYRSVVNAARSRQRRRSVVVRLAVLRHEDQASAEETALKDHLPGPLSTAIATLPRREREVVLSRYYLDLSEKETAEALGLRLGSVKGYASRGLTKLRTAMEERHRQEDEK